VEAGAVRLDGVLKGLVQQVWNEGLKQKAQKRQRDRSGEGEAVRLDDR